MESASREYTRETSPDQQRFLINYKDLPTTVWENLFPALGIPVNEERMKAMQHMARKYSKSPGGSQYFEDDGDKKKKKATNAITGAIETWLNPAFERIEELRKGE